MAVGDLINFKYGTLSQIKQASLNNNTISISTDTGTIWLGNTNVTSRVIDSYLSNNTLYISKISDDGTLSSEQVDLNFARFSDLPVYSAGSGIDISNGEISVVLDTDVFEIVESLPTQNISTKKIYLVSNGDTSGDNMYNEWHYLGHGAWEILGSKNVGINLRDYYTKTEIDAKGYLTSHQDITGKQNILTVGNGIDITNDVISCTLTVPESVSELTNDAGYISTETDPTVPSYVKSITQQNITDWNNKLSTETQLSINQRVAGGGNAITNISVSNHEITLTKGLTFLTAHQDIKTINNQTITGTGNVTINELPTVSSTDNGKVLQVVNGVWTLVSPVTLYSGTGTPSNSQGNNGDLYMQI